MRVEHTLTVIARCPVNDAVDVYEVVFRLARMVKVEHLLEAVDKYRDTKAYQEHITQQLADEFQCEVETRGWHSSVRTMVVCHYAIHGECDLGAGNG